MYSDEVGLMKDRVDKYGLIVLQNKILEIAKYIDDLCNEYDIKYNLMGGSALGAIRHKGFIPWDDDLDIFMTPDNYNKFRDIFINNGNHRKFYLQELGKIGNYVTTPKLRMNNTTFIEESLKNWDIHHGVYVDIFILHTSPNNIIKRYHQYFWAKYIVVKALSLKGYDRKKGLMGIILKITRLLPTHFLHKYALRQVYKYNNKNSQYYCNFLGRARFKRGLYSREWFEESIYTDFERIKLRVPIGVYDFLEKRFGDYLKFPSEDQIKLQQHAWKWDVKVSFQNYLEFESKFKDESKLL